MTPEKYFLFAICIGLIASKTVSGSEGRRLATLVFLTVDPNVDGFASLEEQLPKVENIFVLCMPTIMEFCLEKIFKVQESGIEDVKVETDREEAYERHERWCLTSGTDQTIGF